MNPHTNNFIRIIYPYRGVIYFLLLLFFFHFSWKFAIDGDDDSKYMYVFGENMTPEWFFIACEWLTQAAAWFVGLFPNTDSLVTTKDTLYFPDGGIIIRIIWGCTGIKQMFIFCGIMIFYKMFFFRRQKSYGRKKGKWQIIFPKYTLNKLWYIPMGCIVLTLYNIIRIGSISLLTRGHAERFDDLHNGIFRYIYYGIIFLLWVIWEERYARRYEMKKVKNKKIVNM